MILRGNLGINDMSIEVQATPEKWIHIHSSIGPLYKNLTDR